MSDYDIAVPRHRFREAMNLLADNETLDKGQTTFSDTIAGFVNGKPVELDVHQWIFKHQGDIDDGIWKRAIPVKIQDTTVLVPCPADMFIHQLHNQSHNIFMNQQSENRMKWLFDCQHILLGDLVRDSPYSLDPNVLCERARTFYATFPSRLMLKLFSNCFGEEEYSHLAEKIQPLTRDYVRWLQANIEMRNFLKLYYSYGFEYNGPLTPVRCRMSLKKSFIDYKVYRCTPSPELHKRSWLSYVLWTRRVDSYADFREMYLIRIKDMVLHRE